jgi:aspartate-semialdehyde dehydrogenase
MTHRFALSHASGIIAEAILEKLSESGVSPDSLVLLDEESRAGGRIAYAGRHLSVSDQAQYDLSQCALLLLTQAEPGLEAAALQQGCLLVSHAIDDNRPAIFVGAGSGDLDIAYSETRLRLASPELSCLLPSLIALDRLAGISRLQVTLLRSAEFRGKAGVDELASQTVSLLNARTIESRIFPRQIAFSLIPETTTPGLIADIRHYLGNSSYPLSVQTANVPLFHGFAAAVQLGLCAEASLDSCRECLGRLDQVTLTESLSSQEDDPAHSFCCALSLVEQAPNQPPNLQFWLSADAMRYGLANNYVNVLDFLLKSFL